MWKNFPAASLNHFLYAIERIAILKFAWPSLARQRCLQTLGVQI